MSLRLEMLQVARLAPNQLGESADLVKKFVHAQQNPDGGFKDRKGSSDLYYTVFGVDCLVALQEKLDEERLERFLQKWKVEDRKSQSSILNPQSSTENLDFIHLCCLARCWSVFPKTHWPEGIAEIIARQIEAYRTPDGGYNQTLGAGFGTTYGCFLAWGAYQDLQGAMPNTEGIARCLDSLRTRDGVYSNHPNMPEGTTTATAAAATLLRQLGAPIPPEVAPWLLARCHADGGFFALPKAPMPDLLSTATALHALVGMQADISRIKEPCLDFVDSLWTNDGGFHGYWADDALDVEYTYYGLLALGHLSL